MPLSSRLVSLLASICVAMPLASAEPATAPEPTEQDIASAFQTKNFAQAEGLCRRRLALHPDNAVAAYNLACALARESQPEAALDALSTSEKTGFSDAEYALADADLTSLRTHPTFIEILKAIRVHAQAPVGLGARYEPGVAIPSLITREGLPGHGLRWRLRMGSHANSTAPQRPVIWLHPAGSSGDRFVEPLATTLVAHGFALVVFSQKQYNTWTPEEIAAIPPTIADLAQVPGIDASRPVLMGFGVGGQAGLTVWKSSPGTVAGLLLDATSPCDSATHSLTPPSAEEIAAKTPIMAIIGDQDEDLALWRQALPAWTAAGIPLTVHVVAGHGSEFLLSGADWDAALAWLDAVVRNPASSVPAGVQHPP